MLDRRPLGEIDAEFADQGESVNFVDSLDGGEVEAADVIEGVADVELRIVRLAAPHPRLRGQRLEPPNALRIVRNTGQKKF